MKYIVSIFQVINRNWTSRMFTLALILLGTYSATTIFTAKAKVRCEDCTPYQEQVRILSQTLEQVSKAVDALSQTSSYIPNLGEVRSNFEFASYDTTKRPLTQSQQQVILKNLKKKIDSARWKVDSINRSQQKQIPQTKT